MHAAKNDGPLCLPLPRIPLVDHQKFPKIPRFNREIIITEKIDGTNGVVYVAPTRDVMVDRSGHTPFDVTALYGDLPPVEQQPMRVYAGSRNRWITPERDNYGFAAWVREHEVELQGLGPGFHYGEWYGQGIQRNYGLDHRRFALFNVHRWADPNWRPACCGFVAVLQRRSIPCMDIGGSALSWLRTHGSAIVPGFMNPEGIVIYHTAAKQLFKVTLENDEKPKGVSP